MPKKVALAPSTVRLIESMRKLKAAMKRLGAIQGRFLKVDVAARERGRRLDKKIEALLIRIRKLPKYR